MFDLRGIAIGIGSVIVLIAALLTLDHLREPKSLATVMPRAVACFKTGTNTGCELPMANELLSYGSGADIMDALSKNLSAQQCHYAGHYVGRAAYDKIGNIEDALRQCDRSCDSACVHGIIGEAFAKRLGYDDPDVDLKHLDPKTVLTVGNELCKDPEACHGVGHAIYQAYEDIPDAVAMCSKVATSGMQSYCYGGMFMEYADGLSERAMRSLPDTFPPKIDDLSSFCSLKTIAERRACYKYFPRIAVVTYAKAGVDETGALANVQKICESRQTPEARADCIVGMGVYSSYSILKSYRESKQFCSRFETDLDRATCYLGQISIATQERQKNLIKYCSTLGDAFQGACDQGVFYFLKRLGTSDDAAQTLCSSNDAVCMSAFSKRALDPWQVIAATFAR